MRWFPHPEATKIASKVFPAHRPRVRQESTGKLCRLDSTPQGRVEIVRTEEGPFLVAAERPPRTEASIRGISLPPDLVERWNKAGLRPWKAIARDCRDVCEVIPALTEPEPAEERPAAAPADALLLPPPPPRKLVGSGRILLAERLAALTGAHACLRPLPQLVGPSGIGRRTLTAALGPLGFSLFGELPLGRLALRRVFSMPGEAVNDALLAIGQQMSPRDVLLVSDAEILARFDDATREQLLRELSRLPHVVLIATVPGRVSRLGLLTLRVGGLEPREARAWIAAEYPEIQFAGAALELLFRAASLPRSGEVSPGRVRWLIELARSLVPAPAEAGPAGEPAPAGDVRASHRAVLLSPDEITAAVALTMSSGRRAKEAGR